MEFLRLHGDRHGGGVDRIDGDVYHLGRDLGFWSRVNFRSRPDHGDHPAHGEKLGGPTDKCFHGAGSSNHDAEHGALGIIAPERTQTPTSEISHLETFSPHACGP